MWSPGMIQKTKHSQQTLQTLTGPLSVQPVATWI